MAIHPTAIVSNGAVIGSDTDIGPYSIIGPNVHIGDGTRVMSHVVIDGYTTIGKSCTIFPFASLGTQTQDLKFRGGKTFVEIGDRNTIREYVTINSATNDGEKTVVGSGCHICAYCHVAHACVVGNDVIMSNGATLAGHVKVEDMVVMGGLCAVHQFCRVGKLSMIGGMTRVVQDCPPFMIVEGNPSDVRGPNTIGLKRRNADEHIQKLIKEAYRILYRSDLSTTQALERIVKELEMVPEVEHFVAFIKSSERGIIK
ncbi:MAG: acyl-[acyl-carrier-protein]--UDP-N-acetylglucosamine O-acyltransferase [Lentisphaerae bacterium RIFOXYA12_FULL_48_11]|nr:MAG: acyl-[acyl-carrier-protein]--UDP-N-acetylglucosamine O-acyltransferase [Lentisphaerae bacterium RIFOXYA12_FULL_48_11]